MKVCPGERGMPLFPRLRGSRRRCAWSTCAFRVAISPGRRAPALGYRLPSGGTSTDNPAMFFVCAGFGAMPLRRRRRTLSSALCRVERRLLHFKKGTSPTVGSPLLCRAGLLRPSCRCRRRPRGSRGTSAGRPPRPQRDGAKRGALVVRTIRRLHRARGRWCGWSAPAR